MKMAERGLVSAPNMAVGEPFNIGITTTAQVSPMASLAAIPDVSGASAQPGPDFYQCCGFAGAALI
jgi:hypothetical protein